jgi:hypothetical protein
MTRYAVARLEEIEELTDGRDESDPDSDSDSDEEPETTVIALGGTPGKAYQSSSDRADRRLATRRQGGDSGAVN